MCNKGSHTPEDSLYIAVVVRYCHITHIRFPCLEQADSSNQWASSESRQEHSVLFIITFIMLKNKTHVWIYTTSQTEVAALTQFMSIISIRFVINVGSKCMCLSRLLLSEYSSRTVFWLILSNIFPYLVWLSSPNRLEFDSIIFPSASLFLPRIIWVTYTITKNS